MRYAYEVANKRERRKLTFCGKTNVLTYAHDLWQRVFDEVGEEYPDVQKDYKHVDAWCLLVIQQPDLFDVVVTDNQLRDISTDLAAVLQGGLGVAASGNLNPEGVSMFEPIGGSAPKYTGQNKANPGAVLLSGAMLLEHLGWDAAAKLVNKGVEATFAESDETARKGPGGKLYVTYDIARQFAGYGEKAGASSAEFAERIIYHMQRG